MAEIADESITVRDVQMTLQAAMREKQFPPEMIQVYIPQLIDQMIAERAQAYQAARRGPPSAELARMRARVTRTIQQLESGRLTYAAFAQHLQALDAEYQTQLRQVQGPER